MNSSTVIVRNHDLEVVNRKDEHTLFDPSTGQVFELNAMAMAIWEACDGLTTVDEIVSAIAQLADVAPAEVEESVVSSVNELVDRGLANRQPTID